MKQTRDQLIKENTNLWAKNDALTTKSETVRTEFAKAFDWRKEGAYFSHSEQYRTPSWEEIFVEVGKLLGEDPKRYIESRLNAIENKVFPIKLVKTK